TEPQAAQAPVDPNVVKTLGIDRGKSPWRTIIKLLILVAVLGAVGFGVLRYMRERESKATPQYKTAEVGLADIRATITATGTVKGLNTVEVGAETSGKITKVHVDFNDRVKRGQVLAEIDPEQARASVDETAARVSAADAQIREAKAVLEEAKANL